MYPIATRLQNVLFEYIQFEIINNFIRVFDKVLKHGPNWLNNG